MVSTRAESEMTLGGSGRGPSQVIVGLGPKLGFGSVGFGFGVG